MSNDTMEDYINVKDEGIVSIFAKIKNLIVTPLSYVLKKIVSLFKNVKSKMGSLGDLLWIGVGLLVIALISPMIALNLFVLVAYMAIYVLVFISLWNAVGSVVGKAMA